MSDPVKIEREETVLVPTHPNVTENIDKLVEDAKARGLEVMVVAPDDILGRSDPRRPIIQEAMARARAIKAQRERMVTFDAIYAESMAQDKVDPKDFFISVGPGEYEGRYYGCVMRPSTDEEIEAGSDPFTVVAVEVGMGHEKDIEAKTAASQRYPTIPVLMGDEYFYPCFKSYDRKRRILQAAEDRRQRRGMTHRPNQHGKKQFWRPQDPTRIMCACGDTKDKHRGNKMMGACGNENCQTKCQRFEQVYGVDAHLITGPDVIDESSEVTPEMIEGVKDLMQGHKDED
jgi:hypothetical protein